MVYKNESRIRQFVSNAGFQFPNSVTLLILLAGMLTLTALTINNLYPIFASYFDEDENMAVQISVQRNDTSKFPQLFLCVPITADGGHLRKLIYDLMKDPRNCTNASLDCAVLRANQWDVWKDINRSSLSFPYELIEAFLDKLISGEQDVSRLFDSENLPWHKPIIDVAWLLLRGFNMIDAYFYRSETNFDWSRRFMRDDVSPKRIDQIFDGLISLLCKMMVIKSGTYTSAPTWNFLQCSRNISDSAAVKIPGDALCFQLPTYLKNFQIRVLPSFFEYSLTRSPFSIYSEELLYQSPPVDKEPTMRQEVVTVKYSANTIIREERESKSRYWDKSQADCTSRCKTDAIADACDCVPFTYRRLKNSTKTQNYCTASRLEKCRPKTDCLKECETAYEYAAFEWKLTQRLSDLRPASFQLSVEQVVKPYFQFNVIVKDSTDKLFSDIGGVFGLYLDLSCWSAVLFLVSGLSYYRQWRQQQSAERQTAYEFFPTIWKWKWLVLTGAFSTGVFHDKNQNDENLQMQMAALKTEILNEVNKMLKNGKKDNFDEIVDLEEIHHM